MENEHNNPPAPPELPPPVKLLQMATGYWVSQAIYVAAKLRIADLLKDGPKTAEQLAELTQVNSDSLYRLLRALASLGIFTETTPHSFGLNSTAEFLRSDVPGSVCAMAIMLGEEHYSAWGNLMHSVKTGGSAFEATFGKTLFDYLAVTPSASETFNQAMTSFASQSLDVANSHDFSQYERIIDVGGGHGILLTAILKTYPNLKGDIFDLPHTVEGVKDGLDPAVHDRCQTIGGSFFDSVPDGYDAYILSNVIHDWNDENCDKILASCHKAIAPGKKLLMVEQLVPPGDQFAFSKLLDLNMLILTVGGRERTEDEYRSLLAKSGFTLTNITALPSGKHIIEATRD